MSLYRLSLLSIAGCLAGLALLLIVTLGSYQQMRARQAEVGELLELGARIDDFSHASDSLVLFGADPDLWRAYRDEAQVLRDRLGRLGESHPDARKAARHIQAMVRSVAAALEVADAGTGMPGSDRGIGPLDVPARSRIIMQQVASHGIALDVVLDDALRGRQQAIAREATMIGATLAVAALLFGALCVIAFGLIHRRVALPARALADTLERIRAGDANARAPVAGDDELSRLAETLNRTLDDAQSAEHALKERQDHLEQTLSELETTRDRLLRAQNVGRIGSWEVDLAEERLDWSDEVFEIFGIRREDFDGTEAAFFELVHPDDREGLASERADWLERGGDLDAEHRIVRPGGEVRWVRERARVLTGSDGQRTGMAGTVQDVTDLHRLNAHLRHYERLVEYSSDRFCIIDSSFRYVLVDEAYAALYGMDRDALEGTAVQDVVSAEFFEREARPRIERCLAGETVQFEAQRTYDSIGTRHFLIEYYPLPGADGRIPEVAAVMTDITEQKRLDERARQFHGLIEESEDLCAIIDASYRYRFVNRAYADRYGREPEELEGRTLPELAGDEFFEQIRPRFDRALAGEPQNFEEQREHPDLGRRQVIVRYIPIELSSGSEALVGVVVSDITEIREAETALAEQARLLEIAAQAARFGAWSADLEHDRIEWSNVVAEIHGMPHGYAPDIEEGIHFYAPEHRERIRDVFAACVRQGQPYDEELQVIDAEGNRVWVRAIGRPVYDETGRITRVHGAFQDISQQRQMSDRLHAYRKLIESSEDPFHMVDRHFRYVLVNRAYARRHRGEAGDIEGRSVGSIVGREYFDKHLRPYYERCLAGEPQRIETRYEYPGLGERHMQESYNPIATPDGEITHVGVVISDITELKRAQHELMQSRDDLAKLLETRKALINSLPAHIAVLDRDARIVDVNDQWRHFGRENALPDADFGIGSNYIRICDAASGECAEEAAEVARGLREVLAGRRDVFALEYPCHAPHEERWFRVMVNRLWPSTADEESLGAVVMHVNITERKKAEVELARVAYEDRLTGLYSRNGFGDALAERLERSDDTGGLVAILDIVGQRDVNDAHGYETGDRLLEELGRRLGPVAGSDAIIGRIGGDEFALYLSPHPEADPDERIKAVAAAVREPFTLGDVTIEVSARIGFTRVHGGHHDVEGLMREAELALFQSRTGGLEAQQDWLAYTRELDEAVHHRVRTTHELRDALKREEFELHFQPKVQLEDGRLISAEALIRWHHPERGLQPPGLFIPVAEQSQLIGPIGDWALRRACRHLRDWKDEGLEIVRVAVNVSLVQFMVGDFTGRVRAALDEFEVDPSNLTLEITESVFERESDALLRQIRELHELGVRLSLDDFGTGYSSLLYLQKYPFDEIKVDQGFVRRVLDDQYSRDIVKTVMGLAHALGAEVVAEGIEDADVRDALVQMGCLTGQGFYYSFPLEAEDFRWLLEQQANLPLAAKAGSA